MSSATPGLATALERLGTETAFSVLARAKALERSGRSIVHLEIGEPDFDTAPHIVDAAVEAMRSGLTHYCPAAGLDDFRESIAGYFSRTRGVDVEAANCLVATGAKPFLFFTVLACCNPGDEVIYPDPGFPIYESAIRWAGAVPVPLELREEEGFSLDPERLAEPAVATRRSSSSSTTRRTQRRHARRAPPSRRSLRSSRRRRPGSSPTRSTRSCNTTSRSRASRASARCSSGRSCSTGCRRRTR